MTQCWIQQKGFFILKYFVFRIAQLPHFSKKHNDKVQSHSKSASGVQQNYLSKTTTTKTEKKQLWYGNMAFSKSGSWLSTCEGFLPGLASDSAIQSAQHTRVFQNALQEQFKITRMTPLTIHAVLQMSAGVLYPDPINTSKDRYCLVWMSSVKCLC